VHVNLIFVGFDGDGQNGIKIPSHLFEEWFDHLEHSLEHEILPVGDEPQGTRKCVWRFHDIDSLITTFTDSYPNFQ
jgi:hypothetical protein